MIKNNYIMNDKNLSLEKLLIEFWEFYTDFFEKKIRVSIKSDIPLEKKENYLISIEDPIDIEHE